MFTEKTLIDFWVGKFHITLRQNYLYKDKNTGEVHYNHIFNIKSCSYENGDYKSHDWLNFYTGWHYPEFVYDTCEYEGNRHNLRVSIGYGILYLYFPWRNHSEEVLKWGGEDINNPQPKYGFYLYGEGHFFDSFWYYLNKNGHSDTKCIHMPWVSSFYRHSYLTHDGWFTVLESERSKAHKENKNTYQYPYYLSDDDERLIKQSFPFKYVTKYGEVQETTATVFMEEREWRPKWLRWTSLFNFVRTSLSISFKDEMGNQRGSWKGGVLGCSCEVTEDEKNNMDFITPLRRYEAYVNRVHDYDR